ncbi:MAG: hypothetical protein ACLFQM_04940 [Fidelibacterota bacterium]
MQPKSNIFLAHAAVNRLILFSFILLIMTGRFFNRFSDYETLFYTGITIFLSTLFPYLFAKFMTNFISRLLFPLGYILTVLGMLGIACNGAHPFWILLVAIGIGFINGLMICLENNHYFHQKQNQLQNLSKIEFSFNLIKILVIVIFTIGLHFKLSQIMMPGLAGLLLISFLLYQRLNKTPSKIIPAPNIPFSKPEKLTIFTMAFVSAILWQPFYLFFLVMIKHIRRPLPQMLWILLIPSLIFLVFTPGISGLFNYLRKAKREPANISKLFFGMALLSCVFIVMTITPVTFSSVIVLFLILGVAAIFTLPVLYWLMISVFKKSPVHFLPVVDLLTGTLIILFTGFYIFMKVNIASI